MKGKENIYIIDKFTQVNLQTPQKRLHINSGYAYSIAPTTINPPTVPTGHTDSLAARVNFPMNSTREVGHLTETRERSPYDPRFPPSDYHTS